MECLNNEIERIIFHKKHTKANCPVKIKLNVAALRFIAEICRQEPIISFPHNDKIRDLLGINSTTIYEEYNLSPNPVDILSFDNVFLECEFAQIMIFRGKRSGIILNWTMTVDPGFNYVDKSSGGISWYMMESKYIISSICFKL